MDNDTKYDYEDRGGWEQALEDQALAEFFGADLDQYDDDPNPYLGTYSEE